MVPSASLTTRWNDRVVDFEEADVRRWLHALPKCELHAHLSGSVGARTIRALEARQLQCRGGTADGAATETTTEPKTETGASEETAAHPDPRDLGACFAVFARLHRLLDSLDALALATQHVLEDFAADNCVYLELRTTPRAFHSAPSPSTCLSTHQGDAGVSSASSATTTTTTTSTKAQYVATIVRAMKDAEQHLRTPSGCPFRTRLLLSVDRRQSLDEAFETVELAHRFAREDGAYVVGLDFSGDPTKSSFAAFLPAFQRARACGLRCTVHCAEIADEQDTWSILRDFAPDRLGHMVCFTPDMFATLLKGDERVNGRIPIEICPTSNLITQSVRSFDEHPFGEFLAHDYPVTICTDDMGVFQITLTEEYLAMARSFRLTFERVWSLVERSFTCAFVGRPHPVQQTSRSSEETRVGTLGSNHGGAIFDELREVVAKQRTVLDARLCELTQLRKIVPRCE